MNQTFRLNSKIVLFLATVWMVFQFFSIKRYDAIVWQNEMSSYYAYLPALFADKDLGLEKMERAPEYSAKYYFPKPGAVRGHVIKSSMGVAITQLPFFIIGHIIALCSNDADDGFSAPYKVLIMLSAIFYCLLGLIFIRKTLLYFFSDSVTSLVLITCIAGTNLYFYTLHEAAMSHVYSFAIISVFVYLTVSWHRVSSPYKLIVIAIILALITLIRPVNVCVVLFFILYKDASQDSFKQKFILLFSQWKFILFACFAFFLCLLPQSIYWHYLTGDWMYYSYGEEGFFWLKPKIWLGFFSYQKGWLVWTPVMWFAIVGFLFLRKEKRKLFLPVFISVAIYVYIIFCWWCWWYGGGFGLRAMIDVTAILAIPLAACYRYFLNSKLLVYPFFGILVFLFALNIFQTNQYVAGKLHWDGTSKELYWKLFLNNYPKGEYQSLQKSPKIEEAIVGESGLD